ncbi:drug/metabolite transporter superfamily [Macrolepiota fuliginosa MF-IS2]|uniref:Drug/metabolite transporter superfamily n=1 Tax=Macrolepiota fuliginosa MF-IS2 TaxID=1400762 RepID=A0A9P5WYT9_9AGAR|nr:drug/metabolite transporter superfamily [Macrolepiota fuliginosa MF-IS2]
MRDTYQRNTGLLLVVASQIFLSLMNLAAKKLNSIDPPVSILEIILVRMGITYICSTTYMLSTGVPDPFTGPKGVRLLLAFRGFAGFFGLFGIYFSLQFLSLSDATVLTFLAPLCTSVTGALFLGEKFTRREAFAALLSLVGVILIARPPFIFGSNNTQIPDVIHQGDNTDAPTNEVTPEERLIAVGVGLVGVLGATGAYTSLRAIGKRAHPLHSLVSYSTQSVIVASIGMIVTKTPFIMPTRLDWFAMLVMIGIFGFNAQVLLTMGFARETAGRCSMGMYTQIIFATILEQIFYHTTPAILSVIGTLIIISCALYIAVCVKLAVVYVYH